MPEGIVLALLMLGFAGGIGVTIAVYSGFNMRRNGRQWKLVEDTI